MAFAVAARVQSSLSLALLHHTAFRDSLVQQMGFTILEVSTSEHPGPATTCVSICAHTERCVMWNRFGELPVLIAGPFQVRMSPDSLKAYILWEAYPEKEHDAEVMVARR